MYNTELDDVDIVEGCDDAVVERTAEELEEVEWVADTLGRSRQLTAAEVPRDLANARPGEHIFVDNKSYTEQHVRGGKHNCFFLVDGGTLLHDKVDVATKDQNGIAFRTLAVKLGLHKLPYQCNVYTDGCGSMKHVHDMCIKLGINCNYLPPGDQSLNLAEKALDIAFSGARKHMHHTGAPAALKPYAVTFHNQVHNRMATTEDRGFKTPIEGWTGKPPRVDKLRPFYCRATVKATDAQLGALKSRGEYNCNSVSGRFLCFEEGNIFAANGPPLLPMILLPNNYLIRRRDPTWDVNDCREPPKTAPKQAIAVADAVAAAEEYVRFEGALSVPSEGANHGYSEPYSALRSVDELQSLEFNPLASSSPATNLSDMSSLMDELPSPQPLGFSHSPQLNPSPVSSPLPPDPNAALGPRTRNMPDMYKPGDTTMERKVSTITTGWLDIVGGQELSKRQTFLNTIEEIECNRAMLKNLSQGMDEFNAKLDRAIKDLHVKHKVNQTRINADTTAVLQGAEYIALMAQKDMSWKQALQSSGRENALQALDQELTSLQDTILTRITRDHPDWETAIAQATTGRLLLDIKRSGQWKVRGVKQGFKEDRIQADGPCFVYYSHVARLASVRTALFRPRRGTRRLALKDIATAFLQSDSYEDGHKKYVSFQHPVTKEWMYFEQSGPIYGEASAPRRWEDTVAPWLVSQGFVRGENEKSIFHHPERDLLLILYVDDALVDGEESDINWLFTAMDKRFKCKPAEWLTVDEPLDYLGMDISVDDTHIYLSMHKYIENTLELLDFTQLKPVRTPINADIDGSSPILKPHMLRKFMTAVGCIGWLCNTGRPDIAYAHSRVAQHMANPTESAWTAVKRIFQYLQGTKTRCLSAPLNEPDVDPTTINLRDNPARAEDWKFYCDSDFAGNTEPQNKRRSQNGYIAIHNTAPVFWASKASSVCFAHPKIGEAHADMSSGAAEVYAAGNATLDFLHISYVSDEVGLGFHLPFKLEMDNDAARAFADDTVIKTKLKHIDTRQDWVRILRDKSICTPTYVPTKLNVADVFTKILGGDDFERLVHMMMPRNCPQRKEKNCVVQIARMFPIWTA